MEARGAIGSTTKPLDTSSKDSSATLSQKLGEPAAYPPCAALPPRRSATLAARFTRTLRRTGSDTRSTTRAATHAARRRRRTGRASLSCASSVLHSSTRWRRRVAGRRRTGPRIRSVSRRRTGRGQRGLGAAQTPASPARGLSVPSPSGGALFERGDLRFEATDHLGASSSSASSASILRIAWSIMSSVMTVTSLACLDRPYALSSSSRAAAIRVG